MQAYLLPLVILGIPATVLLLFFIVRNILLKKKDTLFNSSSRYSSESTSIIKQANKRLTTHPSDVLALQTLSDVYYQINDYANAMKYYKILTESSKITDKTKLMTNYLHFGISAMKCKDWETARKVLMMAKATEPENFEVGVNLGIVYFNLGQFNMTVELLNHLIRQKPGHGNTMKYLGESLFQLKRFSEAFHHLEKATEKFREDWDLHYMLGRCAYEDNRMDKALQVFQKLRTNEKWGVYANLYLGHIHAHRKQWSDAINSYKMGINFPDIDPKILMEMKYSLFRSLCHDNHLEEGIEIAQEIYSINPDYKDINALLKQYRELNSNKNMRIYLKGAIGDFIKLAQQICKQYYKKSLRRIDEKIFSTQEYIELSAIVFIQKGEYTSLICFLRTEGQVGELFVREFHARLKERHAFQGICFSPGYFSMEAKNFAEARTIELVDRANLMEMLKRCQQKSEN